jgi:hypothetical protein
MWDAIATKTGFLKLKIVCFMHIQKQPSRSIGIRHTERFAWRQHDFRCPRPIAFSLVINLFDDADKFVHCNHIIFNIRGSGVVTPKLRCSLVALDVTGADSHRLHPDQGLTRTGIWKRDVFECVVLRTVADDG